MIPNKVVSSTPIPAPYLVPDDLPVEALTDYEMGGVALQDPSQGLLVKVWTCKLIGNDLTVFATDVAPTVLFTRSGITEFSFTFDQNMNPCVAFMQDGVLTLWWFDSFLGAQVFTTFAGNNTPKVALDDKRELETGASDIILCYLRDEKLYFRAQRDRFLIETHLYDVPGYIFKKMGMNTVNRLQWEFEPIPEVA